MIDSPNTWMAIAVRDPDGQRFEQHTHTLTHSALYPHIHSYSTRDESDCMIIFLGRWGFDELSNLGILHKRCCRAKL